MKKIFISYKQGGLSNDELNKNLGFIREKLNKLNYKNFIYYFDNEFKNINPNIINENAFLEIKKADIILGFINHKEKSEGQLLELGMSYALGKKIILLVNNNIKKNYLLSFGLKSKIVYFNYLEEVNFDFLK